jgi:hypothetical protein
MTANFGPSSSSCCRLDSGGSLSTPHRPLRLRTHLYLNMSSLVELRILLKEKRPLSGRRSFKVIKVLDEKCSDQSNGLDESRLEIDTERGRVVQAGCRAGSALYQLLKASAPRLATLQFMAYVLLAETTRGSIHQQFASQVSLHALPEALRPQGMRFEGAYRTSATKLSIEAFKALSPRPNGRKSKATTT